MDREPYFLVIGLDFGTCFSKIVVQSHGLDKGVAHPVYVEGDHLLPAVVGLDGGYLFGPMCRPLPGALTFLKIFAREVIHRRGGESIEVQIPTHLQQLLDTYGEERALEILLAWYFANLIAATREFIRSHTDWSDFDFENDETEDFWTFQLCVPTGYQSDPKTAELFLHTLRVGFLLAPQLGGNMYQRTRSEDVAGFCSHWRRNLFPAGLEARCHIYPEVAAAVQTVMRNANAEDGLYLTVDVGAGTVDLNLFQRYTAQGVRDPSSEGEDANNLDYYAMKMAFLGAARIRERQRINPFAGLGIELPTAQRHWGLAPLSENQLMRDLQNELRRLFYRSQQYQRNLGPLGGRRTYDACRVYAWGGGYGHPGYKRAISGALGNLIKSANEPGWDILSLPSPLGLQLPSHMGFDRLAIAYGLSFPKPDLERIRLPAQITLWKDRQPPAEEEARVFPEDYWTNPRYSDY